MVWYITKLVVDSPWPGGGREVFLLASGGGEAFFWCTQGGANLFFCPPDVVFISDDYVINATSLTVSLCMHKSVSKNLKAIGLSNVHGFKGCFTLC